MSEYFLIFMSAALVNNFVLTRFLGLCIFFGVSKNYQASVSMGAAVVTVMTSSSLLAWVVNRLILVPHHLEFLNTVVFVFLIACFVQLLEMVVKKFMPMLYELWGIYILLVATNCIVLGVPLINAEEGFSLGKSLVNAFGSGIGFAFALIMMASIREKLDNAEVPEVLKGHSITFIIAGLLALAFQGFSGMIPK